MGTPVRLNFDSIVWIGKIFCQRLHPISSTQWTWSLSIFAVLYTVEDENWEVVEP